MSAAAVETTAAAAVFAAQQITAVEPDVCRINGIRLPRSSPFNGGAWLI
jgi:hypothetical protein